MSKRPKKTVLQNAEFTADGMIKSVVYDYIYRATYCRLAQCQQEHFSSKNILCISERSFHSRRRYFPEVRYTAIANSVFFQLAVASSDGWEDSALGASVETTSAVSSQFHSVSEGHIASRFRNSNLPQLSRRRSLGEVIRFVGRSLIGHFPRNLTRSFTAVGGSQWFFGPQPSCFRRLLLRHQLPFSAG